MIERLLEGLLRLLHPAAGGEHGRQVAERISLEDEPVGRPTELDRLASEGLGEYMFAAMGMQERLRLAPEHLRDDVVLAARLAAHVRPAHRLVVLSDEGKF